MFVRLPVLGMTAVLAFGAKPFSLPEGGELAPGTSLVAPPHEKP